MGKAYGLEGLGIRADSMAGTSAAGIRRRRGLRIALLSLAAAILLLGAAIAGVFGYHAISDGAAGQASEQATMSWPALPRHSSRPPGQSHLRLAGRTRSDVVRVAS